MNYITNLPDFVEMQRTSFCWFISQGLTDELINFSPILNFSGNIEYVFLAQEYKLVKPIYRKRQVTENDLAELFMPIEMRHKPTNTIIRQGNLPIANLPLMTTAGTFTINGCDRIIVSQIIRSPGIYFEKNKKQKQQRLRRLTLSTDFHKIRPFTRTSFGLLKTHNILSTLPGIKSSHFIEEYAEIKNTFDFITFLKIYSIIARLSKTNLEFQQINRFLILISHYKNRSIIKNNFKKVKVTEILLSFNNLLKFIIKFQILENFIFQTISSNFNSKEFTLPSNKKNITELDTQKIKKFNFLLTEKISKFFKSSQSYQEKFLFTSNFLSIHSKYEIDLKYLYVASNFISTYNKIIQKYQKKTLKSLTNNTLLIFHNTVEKLENIEKLSLLKIKINKRVNSINKLLNILKEHKRAQSSIYFPLFQKYKHTNLVKNKQYFEKKDLYSDKYKKKDLYTATLIPEYGSWIRFGFLRDKKLDGYKYSLNNQFEDDIIIQIDKLTKMPIMHLFREMGLDDLEIAKNLKHKDFFYFNSPTLTTSMNSNIPLLRFNIDGSYRKISEFSRIFDSRYYRLGRIGRYQLNKKLNLKVYQLLSTITYGDIFAIIDYLISLSITKTAGDDIDHLKNRRVRSIGELLQQLFRVGFQRFSRRVLYEVFKPESSLILGSNIISTTVKEFFASSQLSQYMDQTNPLSALTHKRRISGLGPGGLDRDRISFKVRDIHPSHYGRICPIETPEGQNVGLISSLTTCARLNKSGFLETPFWRVINGKVIKTDNPIYLTADVEDLYKIAPADISINEENYLTTNLIFVRYQQDFITVSPSEVDFISISTIQVVSIAASLIPFFEHDDANRALMGSNMQRQSVPLLIPQRPLVGTGLENQIASDSGLTVNAIRSGTVQCATSRTIVIDEGSGKKSEYQLQRNQRSNQETCITQRPIVWNGEIIESGQILADGPSISGGELALGQNVLVAYMPWQGYNFEDAILINERLVYDDVFTSIHIERYEIEVQSTNEGKEQTTKQIPNINPSETQHLNNNGIVSLGTFVKSGDILVGKILPKDDCEQLPESKLLRAIFGAKAKGVRDTSFKMPNGEYGRVIRTITFTCKNKSVIEIERVHVFIAQIRKIQVGDKIAGRHGNKGIISRILPRQDMPFLPDGTCIDILLNPLGVPSRMNVGQLYECLLGFAGQKLNRRFKILPFDELYGQEVSRTLINKKLREASIEKNEAWLFNPYSPGKILLIDGRTGKEFENPITVGTAYMLKLIHLVDDKMHARATGPYSLVTQQPLGGKAQHGGQRFGEMEVWALEGFGAAYTLKELLTIKSDDMQGRNDTLNAIVKGQLIPTSGIPESFKVLLQELRSIGLDISTYRLEKFSTYKTCEREVNLMENYDSRNKIFPSAASNINDILF